MKVAYILTSFPSISKTFIINEIVAMQDKGVEINVYSFFDPGEKVMHPKVKLIKNILHFKPRQWKKILFAHIYWLFRKPAGYFSCFCLALTPSNKLLRIFLSDLVHVREVYSFKPDLLHAHFGGRPADFCMLVKLLTGIPFTFTTHGYDIHRQPCGNLRLKTLQSYRHITISEFNKLTLSEMFRAPIEKISVIRCGIDFKYPLPVAKPGKDNLIISVARLEHIKGLDVLIRACKILEDRGIDFFCRVIGGGPEKTYLEKLIIELGLRNKISLEGALTHDKVFGFLEKSALMVLPSRSESLSVALMEAMACRVPVIGPDLMGNPELVTNGVSGFLVRPEDVEGLADRMIRLLGDDLLRSKFCSLAYEKVRRSFNLETETDKLFNVWQDSLLNNQP